MPDTGPPRRKPIPRLVEVARCVQLTPHMRRITFTGPDLSGFPDDRNGGNIKLFLPETGWRPVFRFVVPIIGLSLLVLGWVAVSRPKRPG